MKKPENLSHHEQLRLDYLYKNYYYLNDKEKKEFDYLRQKSKGIGSSASVPSHEEQPHTVSDAYEQEPVEMDSSGLLPKYPERSSRSRKQKKEPEALAGAGLGQDKPKKPRKKIRLKRILLWAGIFLLMVLGGMIFMFVKGLTTAHTGNSKPAETEFFDGKDTKDGVNILILGTDGRVGDDSTETRTDSIMVLNVKIGQLYA